MNNYQRPGFSAASTPDSHILRAVSSHCPLAAQFLATEERHMTDVAKCAQMRWLRQANTTSDPSPTLSKRLRLTVGAAFVRIGERVQGASPAVAPTGSAG
jgi:hypothetical protein